MYNNWQLFYCFVIVLDLIEYVIDGTRVDDSCTTLHDTCIDDYAECSAGTCTCISGFTWNGLICGNVYTGLRSL